MVAAPAQLIEQWDLGPKQARALQTELASAVIRDDAFGDLTTIAGVDVGFEQQGRVTRAAVVILDAAGRNIVETILVRQPTRFPYVPGLLSFREAPAILAALARAGQTPDLIFCDGHGIAHPRRLGIASHLGLAADIPTIGIGKSRLVGTYQQPGELRNCWEPLHDAEDVIGAVVRTRTAVKPLFVSTGHRVALPTAIKLTLQFAYRFRLPEPIRAADRLASGKIV